MKSAVRLSIDTCCTIEGLCDDYEDLFGTTVPDSVFFDMIVSLGIDSMRVQLEERADSLGKDYSYYA